jgi:hypothetical protein
MIMIPIILLFIDLLSFALFSQWLVYSTFVYLVLVLLRWRTEHEWGTIGVALSSFVLLDFVIHGRVGLGLAFVVPMMFLVFRFKYTLLYANVVIFTLCLLTFFSFESFVLYPYIHDQMPRLTVTIVKFFINLVIGFVVLWYTQGNRSLQNRGRKVWTPNRMSAS